MEYQAVRAPFQVIHYSLITLIDAEGLEKKGFSFTLHFYKGQNSVVVHVYAHWKIIRISLLRDNIKVKTNIVTLLNGSESNKIVMKRIWSCHAEYNPLDWQLWLGNTETLCYLIKTTSRWKYLFKSEVRNISLCFFCSCQKWYRVIKSGIMSDRWYFSFEAIH